MPGERAEGSDRGQELGRGQEKVMLVMNGHENPSFLNGKKIEEQLMR